MTNPVFHNNRKPKPFELITHERVVATVNVKTLDYQCIGICLFSQMTLCAHNVLFMAIYQLVARYIPGFRLSVRSAALPVRSNGLRKVFTKRLQTAPLVRAPLNQLLAVQAPPNGTDPVQPGQVSAEINSNGAGSPERRRFDAVRADDQTSAI